MKTLAFSLAVTLLVVGRCEGGAIPEQYGGETPGGGSQGSGTGGSQSRPSGKMFSVYSYSTKKKKKKKNNNTNNRDILKETFVSTNEPPHAKTNNLRM